MRMLTPFEINELARFSLMVLWQTYHAAVKERIRELRGGDRDYCQNYSHWQSKINIFEAAITLRMEGDKNA